MNEFLRLLLTGIGGVILGSIFFGGLWWTVCRGMSSSQPALWFLVSRLLRTGIVMTGFYLLGQGQWKRISACLLGFIVARMLVVRLARYVGDHNGDTSVKENRHAP